MKKVSLFLTVILLSLSVGAFELPKTSSEGNEVWYIIQFLDGGYVFEANSSGQAINTVNMTGADEQLWKFEGDNINGYTITNKKGYTLYAASANKNEMVYAASQVSGVNKFVINETKFDNHKGAFEIQPKNSIAVSMNLWGGANEHRGVGFWDANKENNPVQFVDFNIFKATENISLIPYPSQLDVIKEGKKSITTLNAITYTDDNVKKYVSDFADQLALTSGVQLTLKESGATANSGEIWLSTDESLPKEGYKLDVTENSIEIKASTKAGFFYALQTMKQLLPRDYFEKSLNKDADWSIPFISITDEPALEHRGFMMDIARHFFDKEEVKRVLDIMALYKMNRLHWHLTDDQGWRIEIPEYPLLTKVGSIRSGSFTSPGEGTKFFDDTEYGRGMWYSQDELREIVQYAAERNIDILPEIDLPGHMVAAVTAYPEFSCDPTKSYSVRIDGGISKDVLNVGNNKVIEFLKCVLDNVASIFPFPYIHIGGDECPTDQWANNAECLQRVKDEGLSGVNQLQSWLVEELGIYLKETHGKDIVVWDELLSHWNSDNTVKPVIMAWNNINKSSEAANKGFKSIITPYSHVYLDFMQVPANKTIIDEPYYGGWGDDHVNTIEEVYTLNPVSALAGKEEYCMGVQGNLWAETLNDDVELEYQLLPRMLALAETGWLPAAQKLWTSFYKRLQTHDEILDALGYTYAKHYIEQRTLSDAEKKIKEAEEILVASQPGAVGFPSADIHNALQDALNAALQDSETATTTLADAITAYKNATICQPQPGKTYQIVSASTYFKKQFAGSTMYISDNNVRFHYTPQTEPEELWQFEATTSGYVLKNLCNGKVLQMPAYNSAVTMANENGTAVRVDKATVATGNYTFIPGVVTISAVEGYSSLATGSVKRLHGELSGNINAYNQPALCYPGTWLIKEVTDFRGQLEGLCTKCERIIEKAKPNEMGQPTQEALTFLQTSVLSSAKEALKDGVVTEEKYNIYVALYNQYLLMPRTNLMTSLSEQHYYYIRNAYPDFASYYATYNSSNNRVEPKTAGNTDEYLWQIKKNSDGTVILYNKASGSSAYINSDLADQTVMVGKEYSWKLEEITVDTGDSGICIIGSEGKNGWYINPNAWGYVLTKPFWGGCIWSLEKSTVQIETSIEDVIENNSAQDEHIVYDLQGRRITNPSNGIYITNKGKKIFIK